MKKFFYAALLLSLIFVVSGCDKETQPTEQKKSDYQKVKLVMSVNGTNIATDTKVALKFAQLVKEESGGNITVEVFPNDQLAGGNASKGIEMISDGAVDLAAYAAGVLAVIDDRLMIATVPWTFNNYREAREVIDTTGGEYYKKVLDEHGMTYLASVHNGFRQMTNNKHPVRTPEDLADLKIRVPGGEVFLKFWKNFAAKPIAMSWSEAYRAIQQGTIDGQENGFSVINSAKVNEIQKYMTVWNYIYENYLFVANRKTFDALEPKTQELIRAKAKEACEWGRDLVEQDEERLKKNFEEGGMEIIVLTPEELKPFQEKFRDVKKELTESFGEDARKAFRIDR